MSLAAGTVSPGSPPNWWRDPGFYKSLAAMVGAILADTLGNGSMSPVVQSVVTGLGGLIAATYVAGNATVRARAITVSAPTLGGGGGSVYTTPAATGVTIAVGAPTMASRDPSADNPLAAPGVSLPPAVSVISTGPVAGPALVAPPLP